MIHHRIGIQGTIRIDELGIRQPGFDIGGKAALKQFQRALISPQAFDGGEAGRYTAKPLRHALRRDAQMLTE